jgi:hypothetical protein
MNGPGDGRMGAVFALALAGICALAGGCDKKDESSSAEVLAPSASSLAPSVAAPAADGMKALKLTIDPAGTTTIDMPAPIEHIKAETSAAAGTLEVDLTNLSNSRGEVKIDLGTLKMHTFGDPARDDAEGRDARTWLEVNPMDGGLSADQAAANRWVQFAIRSIDGLSAADVTKVVPTKDGTDDVREVTMTVHGDLLLHGHKVSKDATLAARFRYPTGAAPTSKPTRVDIATKSPLHVALDEHDVKPRDPAGAIKLAAAGLLGTKVAKIADITLDLHATAAP